MIRQTQLKTAAALLAVGIGASVSATELLTQACEEALALSALPDRLRESASAWTLTEDGYRKTRSGSGNFTCIVARNHPASLIPQCVDAAGADVIIPGIIAKSNWALAGISAADQKKRFAELVQEGRLKAAPRPGLSYMVSDYNYAYSAPRAAMFKIPPHVMFYAPHLSNDDIGGSMQEGMGTNRGMPFIVEQGIHGYMTSMVEHASDSSAVRAACEGQVSDQLPSLVQS